MTVNLLVKTPLTIFSEDGFLKPALVATTLYAMIGVSVSHTGACLNPAVGLS